MRAGENTGLLGCKQIVLKDPGPGLTISILEHSYSSLPPRNSQNIFACMCLSFGWAGVGPSEKDLCSMDKENGHLTVQQSSRLGDLLWTPPPSYWTSVGHKLPPLDPYWTPPVSYWTASGSQQASSVLVHVLPVHLRKFAP